MHSDALPRTRSPAAGSVASTPEVVRVLLVGDCEAGGTRVSEALCGLSRFRCDVRAVPAFEHAVAALRERDYDLVLLDDDLGARSGLDLLDEAFGSGARAPVVLLTATADAELDERAARAGIADVLEIRRLNPFTLERSIGGALERARAERALGTSRAFFHAAFDALHDNAAILAADGTILEVNGAWERFACDNGYVAGGTARGTNYLAVCDAARDDGEQGRRAAEGIRAVVSGMVNRFEMEYPCHAPAEERWFCMRVRRFHDAGQPRVLVAHENVTARHQAREVMQRSEERYRLLFDANPMPMWVIDARELRFLAVNDAAIAHYGYSRDEFLARTAFDIRPAADAAILRELQRGDPARSERYTSTRHTKRSGEVIEVEIISHGITYDGVPARLVLAMDLSGRRAAERERATALGLLQAVVDASPVPIIAADRESRATMWNQAATDLFGWTAADVLGQAPQGVPADRMAEFEFLQRERNAGRSVVNLETERLRKDGTTVNVMLSTTSLRDADGEVAGAVSVFFDITERLRTEAARRVAEAEREHLLLTLEFERNRLATMFQNAPAFIVVLRGPDLVFELANEAYYDLVGRRDLIGRPAREALPELADQGLVAIVNKVLATGEPFVATQMPIQVRRSGGGPLEERFVTFVYQAVVEADGTRSGVMSHGVDVTEQVKAEHTIRASEERYRALVEHSPDGIVIHDGTVIRFANAAAVRLARVGSADDLIGKPVTMFVHPSSRAEADERLQALRDGVPVPVVEQKWVSVDGKEAEVEVTSMGISLAGEPMVQTIFRDVTERRQLEEQLRQSQKMEAVGRLAGGVAHDFNNLLTVIRASTEFLLEDLDHADPRRGDAIEIRTACDRATGLTRQLLAFSRKQILEPRPLDIRQVVGGVKAMLARMIGEDIVLETAIDGPAGSVMADPGQVEQVVMNLVLNARDAMPTGGRVLIETADVTLTDRYVTGERTGVLPGEYVMLAISDTGVGMRPDVSSRIFEPFFTTKPTGQGTGLGLATVYGIVKQSAGHIWVYSEPGTGTTFKVYMPRLGDARVVDTRTPLPEARRPAGSETVLLVEDEEALRAVTRRMLTQQGYRVLEARNGREALQAATQHPGDIHLVLTDVVMPEMGGGALVERLRGVRPEARVLFMSGYTDGDIVRRGVLQPGVSFLQKPFSSTRLFDAVRRTLDAD